MPRRPPAIQALALKHMRAAQAEGHHAQSLMCDRAVMALEAEGYPTEQAEAAVQAVWAKHFADYGAI